MIGRPQIGGVGIAELNRLELEMMRLLEYRLRVPACTVDERVRFLLGRAEAKAGREASSGLVQQGTEDAAEAMVESPQSSAASAGLARVASQESVAGRSPRCLPAKAGSRERATEGGGAQALSDAAGAAAPGPASAFQTGRPPLSFAAAVARLRPSGGSPPGRLTGGWQHQQPQQQQQQQPQHLLQHVAFSATEHDAPCLPGARQPSWPPMAGVPVGGPVIAVRSPSVPPSGLRVKAGAPSFAAVVAAPKRGRGSIDGGFSGGGSRRQTGARGDRPPRPMAPPVSAATAAAAMGGSHVQRVLEGIKAC